MRWKKLLFRMSVFLLLAWLLLVAGLAFAMRQPPETFGKIMARVPGPLYLVLPFETLWTRIRAGKLQPGDPAPDFTLHAPNKASQFHLTSDQQGRPVVLVFGSYT